MPTAALIAPEAGLLSHLANPLFQTPAHLNEEVAYILSQHYYGECLAAELAARAAAGNDENISAIWGQTIRSLAGEEAQHAQLLKAFLEKRLGGVRPPSEHIQPMVEVGLLLPNAAYAFLGVHLVIEPLGVGSLLHLRKHCQDPELAELISLLLRDEGKHMGYLALLENAFGPLSRETALEWAKLCITAMRWQSCPHAWLVQLYGEKQGRDLYEQAMRGKTIAAVAQKGASILCKQLRHLKTLSLPMRELLEAFNRDFKAKDFTDHLERQCA